MAYIFHHIAEAGPPPALLPYQAGPPSHYLEQIRAGRHMLEEVCSKKILNKFF